MRSLTPTPILIWRPVRQEARGGETEWRLVKYLCDPHQDSIDIGSYRGSYTLQMRRYSQFVHAFEPMPSFAEDIARRFRNRFASSEATALASRIALALSTGKSSKSFVYRPLLNPHAPNILYERANEWRHG